MTDIEATVRTAADARSGSLDDFLASLTLRRAVVAFVVTAIVIVALSGRAPGPQIEPAVETVDDDEPQISSGARPPAGPAPLGERRMG